MIVLMRHVGETIVVSEEITVTILSLKDGQVRLGIAAPSDVAVVPNGLRIAEVTVDTRQDSSASEPDASPQCS